MASSSAKDGWNVADPILSDDGRLLVAIALDLMIYVNKPSVDDFDGVLDLYRRVSPAESWQFYKIPETLIWDSVERPLLLSERAKGAGRYPFLDSVRRRIIEGRSVELRLWDRQSPQCWAFMCWRAAKDGVEQAFYRITIPVTANANTLIDFARFFGNSASTLSGHGGYSFSYAPARAGRAFSQIYRLSRRYWCIDIPNLDQIMPYMRNAIKGIGWITLVANQLVERASLGLALRTLEEMQAVTMMTANHGTVLIAGRAPIVGDIHRDAADLEPYFAVAKALKPLLIEEPPEFPDPFAQENYTGRWHQRFLNPP